MPGLSRLQRRVLREAVIENLTSSGLLAPPAHHRVGLGSVAVFLAGALAVAIGMGLWALSSPMGDWLEAAIPASRRPPGVVWQSRAPKAEAVVPEAFPPPQPVDRRVFPLPVTRIVIDPGHGGEQEGTVAPLGGTEKEITLDIGLRLRALLEAEGFQVAMTREGDVEVALDERARLANEAEGDVFVSIHVNSIPDRRTRGVETYVLGATDDPFLARLARSENQDSGYSLADLRELLDGLYADLRYEESRRLARAVQGELYGSLRRLNPEVRDWGIKAAPFIVLIHTRMPAILVEVACLSNREEARLLARESYRQYIALSLFAGIRSYAAGLALEARAVALR